MGRHRPYTIKIELARGCTMRCPFCALPEMDWVDDPWKFMSLDTFKRLTDQIAETWPKLRVEFAERGEQTFNIHLKDMLRYMREQIPLVQMTITSNGDTIQKFKNNGGDEAYVEWVHSLFDDGLNIMMLDCYTAERYEHYKSLFPDAKFFYEDDVHPYSYKGPKTKFVLLVDGTVGDDHIIRHWHNAAGSVNAERAHKHGYNTTVIDEPLEKMCVRPFREIEVQYDGTIPLCCNDWLTENVIGNIHEDHISDLWVAMDEYREPLLRKARSEVVPCYKCSERSGFRVGLEMGWFDD